MAKIAFGTDGWRGIIGKDFTLENVRTVAQAIATFMVDHSLQRRGVVVGYDTRKGSRAFADGVCSVMVGNEIPTFVTDRDTPTPVTAFEVLQKKAGGAVMITASHNPPEWNGIKYIPDYAGPATPEITEQITRNIDRVRASAIIEPAIENGLERHLLEEIDAMTPYIEFVENSIDVKAMEKARLKIICDPMYGTARGYLDQILRRAGCEVQMVHDELDPDFGGSRPEPLPNLLVELRSKVADAKADLGLATDGDADRLAVFDSDGTYLSANQLFPLLFDFMIKNGKGGGVVRTVATTHFVDRIAEKYGFPVYEVPVGFKYVSQYLRERDVVIGAEESGGFSFKGHIPEKDGILTGARVAEMMAKTGQTLSHLFNRLESEFGPCVNGREGAPCSDEFKPTVMRRLSSEIPSRIDDITVLDVSRLDGIELLLEDGGWLLMRPSGTEPLIRIYGESSDAAKLKAMLEQGKQLVSKALRAETEG